MQELNKKRGERRDRVLTADSVESGQLRSWRRVEFPSLDLGSEWGLVVRAGGVCEPGLLGSIHSSGRGGGRLHGGFSGLEPMGWEAGYVKSSH